MHKSTELALAEVGYTEKSASAYKKYGVECLKEKVKYAGSDNYTIYGYEMHNVYPKVMDFPAYWCDAFVDCMFYRAYGVANAKGMIGDFDDYTKNSIILYNDKDAFHLGAKGIKEGDQIFFTKDGTYNGVHHTGLVWCVEDGVIYTVEGNASDKEYTNNGGMVVKRAYSFDDKKIYGYGRPLYEKYEKLTGFSEVNGVTYYFRNGEKVKREWIKEDGKWYRLGINGELLKGWHKIYDADGTLSQYYLDEKTGACWHETAKHNGSLEIWEDK